MSRQFESYYYNNKLEWPYEGRDYHINLRAKAKEYHDPGRQYLRNGDPGDPPEDDFELKSVDAVWYLVTDGNGNEVEVKPTKEMVSDLEDWLESHPELFEEQEM